MIRIGSRPIVRLAGGLTSTDQWQTKSKSWGTDTKDNTIIDRDARDSKPVTRNRQLPGGGFWRLGREKGRRSFIVVFCENFTQHQMLFFILYILVILISSLCNHSQISPVFSKRAGPTTFWWSWIAFSGFLHPVLQTRTNIQDLRALPVGGGDPTRWMWRGPEAGRCQPPRNFQDPEAPPRKQGWLAQKNWQLKGSLKSPKNPQVLNLVLEVDLQASHGGWAKLETNLETVFAGKRGERGAARQKEKLQDRGQEKMGDWTSSRRQNPTNWVREHRLMVGLMSQRGQVGQIGQAADLPQLWILHLHSQSQEKRRSRWWSTTSRCPSLPTTTWWSTPLTSMPPPLDLGLNPPQHFYQLSPPESKSLLLLVRLNNDWALKRFSTRYRFELNRRPLNSLSETRGELIVFWWPNTNTNIIWLLKE